MEGLKHLMYVVLLEADMSSKRRVAHQSTIRMHCRASLPVYQIDRRYVLLEGKLCNGQDKVPGQVCD